MQNAVLAGPDPLRPAWIEATLGALAGRGHASGDPGHPFACGAIAGGRDLGVLAVNGLARQGHDAIETEVATASWLHPYRVGASARRLTGLGPSLPSNDPGERRGSLFGAYPDRSSRRFRARLVRRRLPARPAVRCTGPATGWTLGRIEVATGVVPATAPEGSLSGKIRLPLADIARSRSWRRSVRRFRVSARRSDRQRCGVAAGAGHRALPHAGGLGSAAALGARQGRSLHSRRPGSI